MRSVLCILAVAVGGCAPAGGGTRPGGAAPASSGTRATPPASGSSGAASSTSGTRAPGPATGPDTIPAQYPWSLTDTQEGRWMSYVAVVGGATTRWSIKVVDRDARGWWIEEWTEGPSGAWGVLYCVRGDGRVARAWRATKSDTGWQPIRVVEGPRTERHKPQGRQSIEKLTIRAGEFACWRLDVTVIVQGRPITSTSWHSRDAWRLMWGDEEHGGLVASESGGVRTELEARGQDAKKTFPLPQD